VTSPCRHWLLACVWRLAPLWLALAAPLGAHAAEEDELKAAIIYKLLMFVDWPADALPAMNGTLALCLQPDSRYAEAVKVLAEQPVRGLRLELRTTPPAEPAGACNAILLDDGGPAALSAITRRLKTASVLLIADGADIASEGLVFSVRRVDKKVLFDLNLASARRARLQVSSKLMRLARGVIE